MGVGCKLGATCRKGGAEGVQISAEEAARRQRQRELRELALRLRAEGQPYKRPEKTLEEDKQKQKGTEQERSGGKKEKWKQN